MQSKSNYTFIGLFVVLASFLILLSGLWMSATWQAKKYNVYIVYMTESVSGLNEQAPVRFNGVLVGYVANIHLDQDNPQRVSLLLKIEQGIPITVTTQASLFSQGITGIRYVGLKETKDKSALLETKPGEKYPVIAYQPSLFFEVNEALREITEDITVISDSFKQVFDQENVKVIKNTLFNIEQFTEVLSSNRDELDKSIKQAQVLIDNAAKASDQFPDVLANAQKTLQSLDEAGKQVTKTVGVGQLALESVLQQAFPTTITLLQHLNELVINLRELTFDLKRHPGMLVRGKTSEKPGPGES